MTEWEYDEREHVVRKHAGVLSMVYTTQSIPNASDVKDWSDPPEVVRYDLAHEIDKEMWVGVDGALPTYAELKIEDEDSSKYRKDILAAYTRIGKSPYWHLHWRRDDNGRADKEQNETSKTAHANKLAILRGEVETEWRQVGKPIGSSWENREL